MPLAPRLPLTLWLRNYPSVGTDEIDSAYEWMVARLTPQFLQPIRRATQLITQHRRYRPALSHAVWTLPPTLVTYLPGTCLDHPDDCLITRTPPPLDAPSSPMAYLLMSVTTDGDISFLATESDRSPEIHTYAISLHYLESVIALHHRTVSLNTLRAGFFWGIDAQRAIAERPTTPGHILAELTRSVLQQSDAPWVQRELIPLILQHPNTPASVKLKLLLNSAATSSSTPV